VEVAQDRQVEEGGRQAAGQEHLEGVEVVDVVALVLEHGVELAR
jgi:hypothetical protein